MSVRIVIDSSTDLAPGLSGRVRVIPLSIRFGDREYLQGVDITNEEFYRLLPGSDPLPTTSQAAPYTFEQAYREITEAGDTAVVITVSRKLSGTFQSALIAAEGFEGRVFVVDSRSVAIGAGILAQFALELADRGMDAEAIATALMEQRSRVKVYALLDTLEYLKKGGRISSAVALAGGLLAIKPIIGLRDGLVEMVGKARGAKQGAAALAELIAADGVDREKPVLLGYTGSDPAQMERFARDNAQLWPVEAKAMPHALVGSVVGVHAGPGAVAAAFFAK